MEFFISHLTLLSLLIWFAPYWRGGLTVFSDIRAALVNRQTRIIKTYDEDKYLIETLPGYAEYAKKNSIKERQVCQ